MYMTANSSKAKVNAISVVKGQRQGEKENQGLIPLSIV